MRDDSRLIADEEQLSLLDPEFKALPPFARDYETSREAALSVYETAPTLRARVWRHLRETGGATEEETEAALGLAGNTCRPRIWELRKAGMVEDSGDRRSTRSGRQAVVWRIV